jgi:hypothetical protein
VNRPSPVVAVSRPAPRILYVSSCWPHDSAFGGQIRALSLARALAQIGKVTLAIVGADPVSDEVKARASEEFDVAGEWALEPTTIRGLNALTRSLLNPGFVNIHGLVLSEASESEILARTRTDIDLVWFFQLRTANYFRTAQWPCAVVDVDNLPSSAIQSPDRPSRGFQGVLQRLRTFQARQHELRLTRRFGVVGVCSEADRRTLGSHRSVRVIPNGFERPAAEPIRMPSQPPRIGFIGLLDYEPNRDGIRWFIERCWPTLRAKIPGVRLRLAGKGGDRVVERRVKGVDVLGWIDDAGAEIATWSLSVVPIRSGSGTRIKVADAFSRRCPVVATSMGAYGYEVEDRRHLRLADTADAFVEACLDVLRDPISSAQMADRAWRAYLRAWTWDAIGPRAWEAAEAALRLNCGARNGNSATQSQIGSDHGRTRR